MKLYHVPVKYDSLELPEINLPKNIVLATTIQYIDSVNGIKEQLENKGILVELFKSEHGMIPGQMLGCDIGRDKTYLFIGDGMFHPKALLMGGGIVYVYNPMQEKFFLMDKKEIEGIEKRKKVGLVKFYSSENIGILVTTKPGQGMIKKALELKEKLTEKNVFILLDDTFNFDSLEDFNFVDVFINTMCTRVSYDDSVRMPKPVVDWRDINV